MTSAEESKYIILPAAAVVIITSLMFGIGNTASKAVDQSSPQQSVSTAAVITPVSSVQQPVREEPKKVVETQVPNLPHSTKMMLVSKSQVAPGTVVGVFRVTGWKSGVDSFTKSEAKCGTDTIRDLAYGEGTLQGMKPYPADMQNYVRIVGDNLGGGRYQGSTSYNRYRALCG